jgi:toxin ParE1/3/4
MKLRFTLRAAENLADIADYIHARNPSAARRVRAVILFPHVGRSQQVEGVRKVVTRRFGYLIYYTIDESTDEIVILSVKHPAQKREHSDA